MTELRFDHLRSTRPRNRKPRLVVLHWTGGNRNAVGFFETMRKRTGLRTPDGLSVHHYIGRAGDDWQMCSYDLVCLHAGDVNEDSVGIEIQNPAFIGDLTRSEEKRHGCRRPRVTEEIRGYQFTYADFTPAQYGAVTLRVESLCDTLGIPRRVPVDAAGQLLRRQMTGDELAAFLDSGGGIIGHYHCHKTKRDPGPRLLEYFRQRWA